MAKVSVRKAAMLMLAAAGAERDGQVEVRVGAFSPDFVARPFGPDSCFLQDGERL
jgi:hypothetical protein